MSIRCLVFIVALSSAVLAPLQAQCAQWRDGFGVSGVACVPGFPSEVDAQLARDDGSGAALYEGGVFDAAGEVASAGIARFRGGAWESLGELGWHGPQNPARERVLFAHDAGSGPELYAGGEFQSIGGVSAINIARWTGSGWAPLARGLRHPPTAMATLRRRRRRALVRRRRGVRAHDQRLHHEPRRVGWRCVD